MFQAYFQRGRVIRMDQVADRKIHARPILECGSGRLDLLLVQVEAGDRPCGRAQLENGSE